MTTTFRAGLVALLGLGLLAAPTALASKANAPASKGQMKVQDDGQVFSADSVTKAEAKFNGVTFKAPTHLTVRTFATVPANRKTDFDKVKDDKAKKRTFMKDWARELAQGEGEKGVFVMACMESRSIEVIADHKTDLYQHFTDADADKAYDILSGAFKAASEAKEKSEDEKRAIRGDGLVRVADFVISQLKNQTAPAEHAKGTTGGTHADGDEPKKSGGWPIWLWIVTILGVLLVIWIIVALIRAMTGNVYGGMYGGGYGYGGGGPGFFGMFMGGMLGSMAGMWMYNSMMGTHYAHDPSMASGNYGDNGADGATDTGEGDFDNGAEAGGDWDDAGGDAGGDGGGGGGDWGNDGGGDTGGGGDWGGDGGGGDWGGDSGGGGDFGGGGGDW